MGWYGGTPVFELPELDATGLRPSLGCPGGVKTLVTVGACVFDGVPYVWYLCIPERWSGGGS